MRTGPIIAIAVAILAAFAVAQDGNGQQTPPPARPADLAQGAGGPGANSGPAATVEGSTPQPVDQMAGTGIPEGSDPAASFANDIISAARAQVGVTTIHDPRYVGLDFPGGDVPPDRGVCTDVLIRALRDGADIDLQLTINRDMKSDFAAYPRNWGLSRTDANIDHRRVPNLETLLRRLGAEVAPTTDPADFLPGDIVTMMLPRNLPHILIVSDKRALDGARHLVIHNIGRGTQEEDALFAYPHTGHFRLAGDALSELRRLGQLEY